MSTFEYYYYGESGHMQVLCSNSKKNLRSYKEMNENNKVDDAHSTHMIKDGEFFMVSEDIVPDQVMNKS